MTKFTQADYDQATQLHNLATQRHRLATSEHLSGRMNTEDYLQVSEAEKRALYRWEEIRAALYPGT